MRHAIPWRIFNIHKICAYIGGIMKSRRFKGVLAVMLVIVLMLSLVPLETVTPAAMQDKAKTNDSPIESETISEICSQKEVVNNAKPAPADGYIVKLVDESFADGLTCISADDGLYRAENKEQLEEIPGEALGYCEPDYKLSMLEDTSVNDTLYVNGAQWNLENMNVPAAWAKGQFGDGVTVAVIDSGLYGAADGESHEDIDPAKVVSPYNAISGGTNVSDDHGHGTFVAGMIIANTNNSAGIAGIMPNVKLMPIKVSTKDRDASISDVIKAIEYAVDNGADIINMSLGTNDFSEALKTACDNAVEKGVIIVAAAGNDGSSKPCYPAAYDSASVLVRSRVTICWPQHLNTAKAYMLQHPGRELSALTMFLTVINAVPAHHLLLQKLRHWQQWQNPLMVQ